MAKFYSEDTNLPVSKIINGKYWGGNFTEMVKKGTGLPPDFTAVIFQPSADGKTGVYDSVQGQWTEINDNTAIEFYDINGVTYRVNLPDDAIPDWAILEKPPEYDPEKQTVLFIENIADSDDESFDLGWNISDIEVGKKYWSYDGYEQTVSQYNFKLPDGFTFIEKPDVSEGYVALFNGVTWDTYKDLRGQTKYNTDKDSEYYKLGVMIDDIRDSESLGENYTLLVPGYYDEWSGSAWVEDPEQVKIATITDNLVWFNNTTNVIHRLIMSYQIDQDVTDALKANMVTDSQYLEILSDRASIAEWVRTPEAEKPQLSDFLTSLLDFMDQGLDIAQYI